MNDLGQPFTYSQWKMVFKGRDRMFLQVASDFEYELMDKIDSVPYSQICNGICIDVNNLIFELAEYKSVIREVLENE